MQRRAWLKWAAGSVAVPSLCYGAWQYRDALIEKRVAVVVPGRIFRGAWQGPWPLRRILARERIKTVVTLTAINRDDPKYVDQDRVVRDLGVAWRFVNIHGSYATVEQMGQAADLIADPSLHPVFYHCVAGHHRSSQVQAAYRIRHQGWTTQAAWLEVAALPWAKADRDAEDRRLIEAFGVAQAQRRDASHAPSKVAGLRPPAAAGPGRPGRPGDALDLPGLG